MQTSLSHSSDIIMATSRLHNFVITVDSRKDASSDSILLASGSPLIWGYGPTAEKLNPIPGTSQVHDIILSQVLWYGLRRPALNIERCIVELHEIGLM